MAEVLVRRMEEDDLPGCLSLWSDSSREKDLAVRARTLLAQRPRLSVVAELDGRLCGWALVSYNGFSAFIQRIVVAFANREAGVGGLLLEAIEDAAWDAGARDVSLISEESAVAFYERCGYAVTGSRFAYKLLAPVDQKTEAQAFDLEEAMGILTSTPATLKSMLGGLAESWVVTVPPGEDWSPVDVVGHLIAGEVEDWIVRARHILEHGPATPFHPFDRESMRSEAETPRLPDLLDRFDALRAQNISALQALELSAEDLQREGAHPSLGTVTLGELLATWAVHDLSHIAQLSRMLSARYRNAVGPWRSYLAILDR